MKKSMIITAILSLTLAGLVLIQTPKAGERQSTAVAKSKTFTITGKITRTMQTYTIRQQKPPERFAIMNPIPEVLDSLVKSGKIVTIEAISVVGDNVNIEKIDGELYREEKTIKK